MLFGIALRVLALPLACACCALLLAALAMLREPFPAALLPAACGGATGATEAAEAAPLALSLLLAACSAVLEASLAASLFFEALASSSTGAEEEAGVALAFFFCFLFGALRAPELAPAFTFESPPKKKIKTH